MKSNLLIRLSVGLLAAALLLGGCATAPRKPAWQYLQSESKKIAIFPASNRTTKADAQIILDKFWEESLRKAGFTVVNADSVLTFASSRAIALADLPKVPAADIGRDLKADFILENEIVDWDNHYKVISANAVVSCKSRLTEARTGAIVWEHHWIMVNQGNTNNGLAGLLVSAIVNSMFDVTTGLAKTGVTFSTATMPYPGSAPKGTPPPK
jgi:hypothetical protein